MNQHIQCGFSLLNCFNWWCTCDWVWCFFLLIWAKICTVREVWWTGLWGVGRVKGGRCEMKLESEKEDISLELVTSGERLGSFPAGLTALSRNVCDWRPGWGFAPSSLCKQSTEAKQRDLCRGLWCDISTLTACVFYLPFPLLATTRALLKYLQRVCMVLQNSDLKTGHWFLIFQFISPHQETNLLSQS